MPSARRSVLTFSSRVSSADSWALATTGIAGPGGGSDGKPVFLTDLWPTEQEVQSTMLAAVSADMFRQQYGNVFEGDELWRGLPVPTGDRFSWESDSTYVRRPPFLEGLSREQFDKVEGRNANSTLGGTGMRRFNWLVGQPEEIEREYNEVMGWKVPTPQA